MTSCTLYMDYKPTFHRLSCYPVNPHTPPLGSLKPTHTTIKVDGSLEWPAIMFYRALETLELDCIRHVVLIGVLLDFVWSRLTFATYLFIRQSILVYALYTPKSFSPEWKQNRKKKGPWPCRGMLVLSHSPKYHQIHISQVSLKWLKAGIPA